MVEAAARLRDQRVDFRLHVLGGGELEDAVRRDIGTAGLDEHVLMHGTRTDVERWYAACDVLLLTSEFEGLPYAIYEAMAMAKPVVAPRLPGIDELVGPDTGFLVDPRESAEGYAAALAALAADPSMRRDMGRAARARVRATHSLKRMAVEHEALYDELLGGNSALEATGQGKRAPRPTNGAGPDPPNPGLRTRQPGATPLVSVIVPCYNHGRFLGSCLQSIAAQDYKPIETIVVDDGSTDPETLEALANAEASGAVTLVRLDRNRGPSAARNAALSVAKGRYVLPLDADNVLLDGAVAALVEQLSRAGERIGFVFPSYQFLGRSDSFEPPSYNLHALMNTNYCDSCSLIDREVFERGFRYPEDIVLGLEDWDFVLSLAQRGIFGEPAHRKTLLYRKHGFNRNDLSEAGSVRFADVVAERHPALFGLGAQLKARWSPGVSLIALDPVETSESEALGNLVAAAVRQTSDDFEVIVSTAQEVSPTGLGGRLRRIPSQLAGSRAQMLGRAVEIARGRFLLATYGSPATLLSDPALIEKLIRILLMNPRLDALALAESDLRCAPLRLLDNADVKSAKLGALCWPAFGPASPPPPLELPGQHPLKTLACWLSAHATLQWRHVLRRDRRAVSVSGNGPAAPLGEPRRARFRDASIRAHTLPEVPGLPRGVAERVNGLRFWMPAGARPLCRHLHHPSGRYRFSTDPAPPRDCSLHHYLGSVRVLPLTGTKSLFWRQDEDEDAFILGDPVALDMPGLLGFIEQSPLPQFDPLWIARLRDTGQRILVAGAEDPLAEVVDDLVFIGCIEPCPIHPRQPPHIATAYGLVGLVRTIDLHARRHRYAAGRQPDGVLVGELGALLTEPLGDCEPLWIDSAGRVSTASRPERNGRPSPQEAFRWTGAPLTWSGFSSTGSRLRATARRSYDSLRALSSASGPIEIRSGDPAGYVLRSPGRQSVPLYAGRHPVTGDQLLSPTEAEARNCGYQDVELLGHLVARAPVTGSLGLDGGIGIPWASRFGMARG
jgi:hypothetical protein